MSPFIPQSRCNGRGVPVMRVLRITTLIGASLPQRTWATKSTIESVSGITDDTSCESSTPVSGGRALLQSGAEAKAKTKAPKTTKGAAPASAPHGLGLLAGAPNEALVKAHVKAEQEKTELEAQGDELHYSTHGCHCMNEWTWEGRAESGCTRTSTSFNHDWPWCKVTALCEKYEGKVENDEIWDFCTMADELDHHRTMHGCHCNGRFEHDGEIWEGCSKTSQGPTWCYVFEGGVLCSEALKTEHHGQHWDYCFLEEDTSPYLTKNGCHCMPWFIVGEDKYEGCVILPGKDTPGCYIYEDETLCPQAQVVEGTNFFYDECTVPTGKEEEVLMTLAYAGADQCHCMPEWKYEGVFYSGCASTPDGKEDWCYILQDDRLCKDVHGEVEGFRWRYCGEDGGNEEGEKQESKEERSGGENQKPSLQVNVIPMVIPTAGTGNVRIPSESDLGYGINVSGGEKEGEEAGEHGEHAKGAASRLGSMALVLRWPAQVTMIFLCISSLYI